MKILFRREWLFVIVLFVIATLFLNACVPTVMAFNGVKIAGPGDLFYLSVIANDKSANGESVPPVRMTVTPNSIVELKRGSCDVVLLGREPTSDELEGLKDYVIAYDAVCIIIDENSYKGGQSTGGGRPLHKTSGLKQMTFDELGQVFNPDPTLKWKWTGGYFRTNPMLDKGSWLYQVDSIAWLPEPKTIISAFYFPAGKYDTQSVIYQQLNIDEKSVTSKQTSFTSDQYNLEEEVLSYEYSGSAYYSTMYGSQDYPFKLGFASRRAMTIAPQHVPVKVIDLDGINPVEDTQSVYDGSYKLSRKIHCLVRENSGSQVKQLLDFYQSAAGQQAIADAGYLPVSP